ncbi:MAG: outer membrane protein assembly factor BamA [Verrucomicrobiota bacterium]|nr:outer membrane protein assembly factor BamA [Verrucomicrobiota bacterium]
MKKICLIAFALLFSVVLCAAKVDSINVVDSSGKKLSAHLVKSLIPIKKGQEFNPGKLSESIKNLYKTGLYEDIKSDVNTLDNTDLKIVFVVKFKSLLKTVVFIGNENIKTSRLRDEMINAEWEPFDERNVAQEKKDIIKLYIDKGFNDVIIEEKIIRSADSRDISLEYTINEKGRFKVRGVEFVGNKAISDSELFDTIKTKVSRWGYLFPTGYFNKLKFKSDKRTIKDLYKGRGFLDAKITNIEKNYNKKYNKIYLTISLSEGKPYLVSSVKIEGNKQMSDEKLIKKFHLKTATAYNIEHENADIREIAKVYDKAGYVEFRCIPKHIPNPITHELEVIYSIREGIISNVRDIIITGNRVTKDHVIRRELPIMPGDVCDMTRIKVAKSRLANMNYFETVEVTPISPGVPGKKDIKISLREKKTGQFMVGAGFSSTESMLGTIELSQTNFDLKNWPTFRGGGQRMKLQLQAGSDSSSFGVYFTEPWLKHKPLQLDVGLFSNERDYDEYTQENLGFFIGLTKRLKKFWRASVKYSLRNIDLNDFDDNVSTELKSEEDSYIASTVEFTLTRDSRNSYFRPTRGEKLTLTSALTTEILGGYSNILKVSAEGTKYFPVNDICILKLSGLIGSAIKLSGDSIAIFDRYFSGGLYSIRGFEDREVSPVDINEDPLGGQSILTGTAELLFPIVEKVDFVTFSDIGNVWSNEFGYDLGSLNMSVGFGMRLNLPIGPVRLDYGFPIMTDQDHLEDSGRFHFSLGYTF